MKSASKSTKQSSMPKFEISGVWSKTPENIARPICLGILICKPLKQDYGKSSANEKSLSELAGIAGGYYGDGLFQLEQFYAKLKGDKIKCLWLESTDLISGDDVDFNSLPNSTLDICHDALQECWEYNSENNYLESQQLRLYPYNLSGLIPPKTKNPNSNNQSFLFHKPINKIYSKLWNQLRQSLFLVGDSKIPTTKREVQPEQSQAEVQKLEI
jgi:hypothetical protein